MKLFKLSVFFLPLLLFGCKPAPKIGEFTDGYATLDGNRRLNLLSFSTTGSLSTFHDKVGKEFGTPVIDSVYSVYRFQKEELVQDSVVLRIEVSIVLDSIESNYVFITAETYKKRDLLIPGTKSREWLQEYFHYLYKTTL